jgi:4'-phosphopantetheinyl transferase EntD
VLTPPSAALIGESRAYWAPAEVKGCPFGRLVCAVCPSDAPGHALAALLASEQAYASSLSSPQRRREWVGGRICLAAALGAVAVGRSPLLVADSGAPLVPAGWAGSISHKGPLVLALASSAPGAVGVDVECVEHRDGWLHRKVFSEAERKCLGEAEPMKASVMLFSVKEAVFKALEAQEQKDLEFEDIETVLPALVPRNWLPVGVKLAGRTSCLKAAVIFDGDWMIAVAKRELA